MILLCYKDKKISTKTKKTTRPPILHLFGQENFIFIREKAEFCKEMSGAKMNSTAYDLKVK